MINYGIGRCTAQDLLVATSCHAAWMQLEKAEGSRGISNPLNSYILRVEKANYLRKRAEPIVAVSRLLASQVAACYDLRRERSLWRILASTPKGLHPMTTQTSTSRFVSDCRSRAMLGSSCLAAMSIGAKA